MGEISSGIGIRFPDAAEVARIRAQVEAARQVGEDGYWTMRVSDGVALLNRIDALALAVAAAAAYEAIAHVEVLAGIDARKLGIYDAAAPPRWRGPISAERAQEYDAARRSLDLIVEALRR